MNSKYFHRYQDQHPYVKEGKQRHKAVIFSKGIQQAVKSGQERSHQSPTPGCFPPVHLASPTNHTRAPPKMVRQDITHGQCLAQGTDIQLRKQILWSSWEALLCWSLYFCTSHPDKIWASWKISFWNLPSALIISFMLWDLSKVPWAAYVGSHAGTFFFSTLDDLVNFCL